MKTFRKLQGLLIGLGLSLSLAAGAVPSVDVNTADRAQLESISGIGPHMAEMILKERSRGGAFASPEDLASRVPGIGTKRAQKLRAAGLQVGSSPAVRRRGAKAQEATGGMTAPSAVSTPASAPAAAATPAATPAAMAHPAK